MSEDIFDQASSDVSEPSALTIDDNCPVQGKYEGKPIRSIPAGYLSWLSRQDWFADKYPDMHEYICSADMDAHIVKLSKDSKCPIRGKYQGSTMADVPASYLTWIAEQPWAETKYPEILSYCAEECLDIAAEKEAEAWAAARDRTAGE